MLYLYDPLELMLTRERKVLKICVLDVQRRTVKGGYQTNIGLRYLMKTSLDSC